jgi:hypothetical protein
MTNPNNIQLAKDSKEIVNITFFYESSYLRKGEKQINILSKKEYKNGESSIEYIYRVKQTFKTFKDCKNFINSYDAKKLLQTFS